ncbi:uncharacterized protein N7469_002260 [Penicillium citrinum]|uniref:Uncharacterized protein n=1 Tax=Penicillium citrinum TaxID=5077 RepID=A0A9W9TV68_PENCI|nr:uncharacterized protein N7469_002260 [Penicillium citrinum]KAJ5240669.1 hypothetical protein N7469_002260 [Penicillium citrinum]
MSAGLKSAFFEIYYEREDAELLEIYRRFKLRNFYLLAVDLDYHTGERWCRKASTKLARELAQKQPPLDAKEADLKRCLDDYVRLGRKYDRWATELGGQGYLIALPLDITEREYTDRHFSKSFPLAIRKLREGGIDRIVKEHGYDKLGNHISEQLRTQSWPSEPARRHLTKSARRNKRKREAKQDETMRSKKGPGAPHPPKRIRRHEVNCTKPIEFENVCAPEEETPRETNENSPTNSSLSHTRPGSTVDSPTSCENVEHSPDVCERRSSCSLTPQESACEHPLSQEECSSSSETTFSKDEPSNISYDPVEDPTESPIGLLDQPPLDPFLSSDFPHSLFDNPHDLLNDLLDLPSLDPFLASDFPHGHIDDPSVPPVDLLDRPSPDPFLASDFPRGHYVGPSALSVDFSDRPALDPFPASDFPHGYVGNPPALQIDLLDREALDPFPESDFPHRSIKYPTELAHQSFISTSSNCFSPEPSSSDPIGPGNCQPRPPGNNSLVCDSNARPIDDPYTYNIQSEAHKGSNCGPTPVVPVQF